MKKVVWQVIDPSTWKIVVKALMRRYKKWQQLCIQGSLEASNNSSTASTSPSSTATAVATTSSTAPAGTAKADTQASNARRERLLAAINAYEAVEAAGQIMTEAKKKQRNK